jgi:hypothetical protein
LAGTAGISAVTTVEVRPSVPEVRAPPTALVLVAVIVRLKPDGSSAFTLPPVSGIKCYRVA